jgi:hypothetical protein
MQYCNVIVLSSDELPCICVLKGIEFAPFFLRCFDWILEWFRQWIVFCFSFHDFIVISRFTTTSEDDSLLENS